MATVMGPVPRTLSPRELRPNPDQLCRGNAMVVTRNESDSAASA